MFILVAKNTKQYKSFRVEPHPGITGMAPYITPEWGDISRLTSGRIHPSRQKRGWPSAAGVKRAYMIEAAKSRGMSYKR